MAEEQEKAQKATQERQHGEWVKVEDREPPVGKLVYTRSESGLIGAYTLVETSKNFLSWNSWVCNDNEPIVEWFEPYE